MSKIYCIGTYQSRGHSLQKQVRLKTPSLRFPLRAGGTDPSRFPSRSGGNLTEGGKSRTLTTRLVSAFALVFQHAPLPTSPVDGGGAVAPSPRAGRVGVLVRVQRFGEVFEAGAVFPSASVNGQACCIALTPFVPLCRGAGEGERAAGRTAVRPYTPLPRSGRGAGGEGEKACEPRTQ